jgi:LPXTG-motif cell wall-anchored protein
MNISVVLGVVLAVLVLLYMLKRRNRSAIDE